MKFRTFTITAATILSALTLFIGYTAEQLEHAAHHYAGVPDGCAHDAVITAAGQIGCFTPVIAMTDADYFSAPLTLDSE